MLFICALLGNSDSSQRLFQKNILFNTYYQFTSHLGHNLYDNILEFRCTNLNIIRFMLNLYRSRGQAKLQGDVGI